MTDFAASQGEFVGWKADEERRRAFQAELMALAHDTIDSLVGCCISIRAFDEVPDGQRAYFRDQLYWPCLQICLEAIANRTMDAGPGERVEVFIEEQDEFTGAAPIFLRKCIEASRDPARVYHVHTETVNEPVELDRILGLCARPKRALRLLSVGRLDRVRGIQRSGPASPARRARTTSAVGVRGVPETPRFDSLVPDAAVNRRSLAARMGWRSSRPLTAAGRGPASRRRSRAPDEAHVPRLRSRGGLLRQGLRSAWHREASVDGQPYPESTSRFPMLVATER